MNDNRSVRRALKMPGGRNRCAIFLTPEDRAYVKVRACKYNESFSMYVEQLIRNDRKSAGETSVTS